MVERSTMTFDFGRMTGLSIIVDMIGSRNSSGAMAIKSSSKALVAPSSLTRLATICRSPIKAPLPIRPIEFSKE